MPRWLADTVTRRLGVEQLTIDTSHSPFLSRPRELAELLVHATTTRPTGPLVPTNLPSGRRIARNAGVRGFRVLLRCVQKPERMTPLQSAAPWRSFAASW